MHRRQALKVLGGATMARAAAASDAEFEIEVSAVSVQILPLGPVKQHTSEKVDAPLEVTVYPGADGAFLLYDDAGNGFDYRKGQWTGIRMTWNDRRRTLSFRLDSGSKMTRAQYEMAVGTVGSTARRTVAFTGRPLDLKL